MSERERACDKQCESGDGGSGEGCIGEVADKETGGG